MPIFTKCNFYSPLSLEPNNPVNLSVCSAVFKYERYTTDAAAFLTICFVTENRMHQWIFESEQDRDSEFERIMSI